MIKKNKTYQRVNQMSTFFLFILFSSISVAFSGDDAAAVAGDKNPFTPKAFVIRYWDKHILNNLPKPSFLLSKASPLSAIDTAKFTQLAATNTLATRLPEFCSAANLLCLPDVNAILAKHAKDVKFTQYINGADGGFKRFRNYAKSGLHAENEFTISYGTDTNIAGADFSNYAEKGTSPNDTSINYGVHNTNVPTETLKNNANGSVSATQTFANYRDGSNVDDDSFQSYGKNSRGSAKLDLANYGKFFNQGTDTFKGYAKGAELDRKITGWFKKYVTFAGYDVTSSSTNSFDASSMMTNVTSVNGSLVKTWVEPGIFFRERMLKQETVMPMPDIRDKLPKRSFLPRSILSKIPFTLLKIFELKRIFKVSDNSTMDKVMIDSLSECERAPSMGETKRCVGSLEDMIDFATSVLNHNVAVRTTENVNGSKKNVMLGEVKGINGGKVTKSVSCHQSLFPYLLYYCHSVPKVRLYEADLLDPNSKAKINHGVAICHLDTTSWSPTHIAFLALGSGPGRIEVCHWMFENDLIWTIAD